MRKIIKRFTYLYREMKKRANTLNCEKVIKEEREAFNRKKIEIGAKTKSPLNICF